MIKNLSIEVAGVNLKLKNAEQALMQYVALIESSDNAIISKDLEGFITSWNKGAERMFGYSRNEVLGHPIFLLLPKQYMKDEVILLDRIRNGDTVKHYEIVHIRKDGELIDISVTLSPIRDRNGNIIGASKIAHDITARKKAEEENNALLRRYQTLMQNSMDGINIMDVEGNVIEVNDAFCNILGYTREEALRLNVADFDTQWTREELRELFKSVIGRSVRIETSQRRKDGSLIQVEISTCGVEIDDRVYLYAISRDITERKKTEEQMRIAAVTFETDEAIMITDKNANIIRVNHAFQQITGYSAEEALGKNPRILSSGRHDNAFYAAMWQDLLTNGTWTGEVWDKRKSGQIYPKWLTITAIKDKDGSVTDYVAIFSDITARKKAEEEIYSLAYYDILTKLPNRRFMLDRIAQAQSISARSRHYGALLFLDMDRFKTLNDALGHDYGDLFLIEIARRLQQCVRDMDTVARIGGDEFVVLVEEIDLNAEVASQKVALLAEKIRSALSLPYQIKEHEHHSSPSIGASLYRGNDEPLETVLKHADMAMYQAKESGRNRVRFFDPAMQIAIETRTALEADLRHALAEKQLHLYYQIQLDSDLRPLGAEALIRWIHPLRGMVSPMQFIPIAEESSLILDIGHWVLETACKQLAVWDKREQTKNLKLAVNVSAQQFKRHDIVETITTLLNIHQVDPRRLKLELTESVVLSDVNDVITKMHSLKALGVRLSLDDFGTGYSSLSYLKRLPLDQIKIDQSFVRDITTDASDAVMVKTIISLADNFRLNVIAEGVETEAQLSYLKENGCMAYQGFLFSKPVPIDEFEALLNRPE